MTKGASDRLRQENRPLRRYLILYAIWRVSAGPPPKAGSSPRGHCCEKGQSERKRRKNERRLLRLPRWGSCRRRRLMRCHRRVFCFFSPRKRMERFSSRKLRRCDFTDLLSIEGDASSVSLRLPPSPKGKALNPLFRVSTGPRRRRDPPRFLDLTPHSSLVLTLSH